MGIEIKNIREAEGLEVSPHAHTTEIGIKNQSNAPVNVLLISSPPPVKSVEELKDLLKSHE